MRRPFLCLQKNRASPNFAQSELARLPNTRLHVFPEFWLSYR